MGGIALEQFEGQVTSLCATSSVVVGISTVAVGVTWLHLRAYLVDGSFVDTFYNDVSDRTAFALIKNERRIFGADNTGGWHWHPFEDPENHQPADQAVSFRDFLDRVEAWIKAKGSQR